MAAVRLGPALWHIQQLLREGSATGSSGLRNCSGLLPHAMKLHSPASCFCHGLMVLGVCRGVLGDSPDADDAFQATFLVLARKASSPWGEGQLGGWLHKVAYRIAVRTSR